MTPEERAVIDAAREHVAATEALGRGTDANAPPVEGFEYVAAVKRCRAAELALYRAVRALPAPGPREEARRDE